MNKMRAILAAGIVAATPAFIAGATVEAHAFAAAPRQPTQSTHATPDREMLKSALLQWTTAEKLRRAGDRIRLAKTKSPAKTSKRYRPLTDRWGCSKGISGCSGLLVV